MNDLNFQDSHAPEPHLVRRRSLLKKYPELKGLMGFDRSTTYIILAVVLAQYIIAYFVQEVAFLQKWYIFLPLGYIIGGTLNHWAGMGIHECSHNLAAKTSTGNKIVAMIADLVIVVPSAMSFCRNHMGHHTHLGVEEKDNDLPSDWEVQFVKKNKFLKVIWLTFYVFFAVFARGFFQKLNKWEWINIGVTVLSLGALYFFVGGWALAYLGISTFFGYSLLHPAAAHFIHEHYLWEDNQETYSYYGPLNYVNFFVGYHVEHHDIMNIPGRKLHKIKEIAPEYYNGLESTKSWVQVILEFIKRDDLGHHKRIVRPKAHLKAFDVNSTPESLFEPLKLA